MIENIDKYSVTEITSICNHYGLDYKNKLKRSGNVSIVEYVSQNGYSQEASDIPPMIFSNKNLMTISICSFKQIHNGKIYKFNYKTSDLEALSIFSTECGNEYDPFSHMEAANSIQLENTTSKNKNNNGSYEKIEKYTCLWDKNNQTYQYMISLMGKCRIFEMLTDNIVFCVLGSKCVFIRISELDMSFKYNIVFNMIEGMTYSGNDIKNRTLYFTSFHDQQQFQRTWFVWELNIEHIIDDLTELNLNEGFSIIDYNDEERIEQISSKSNNVSKYLKNEYLFKHHSTKYEYVDNIVYKDHKFDHKDSLGYEIIGHNINNDGLFHLKNYQFKLNDKPKSLYNTTIDSSDINQQCMMTSDSLLNLASNGILIEFALVNHKLSMPIHFINMFDYKNKVRISLPRDLMMFKYCIVFNFKHYFVFVGNQIVKLDKLSLNFFYMFNCITRRFRKIHIDINFNSKTRHISDCVKIDENGNLYFLDNDQCHYYNMSHIYHEEANLNIFNQTQNNPRQEDDDSKYHYYHQLTEKPMLDRFPNIESYSDIKVVLKTECQRTFEYNIHSWIFNPLLKNSSTFNNLSDRRIIVEKTNMKTVDLFNNILMFVYGDRTREVQKHIIPLLNIKKERLENNQLELLLANITNDKQAYSELSNYFFDDIKGECGELPLVYSRRLVFSHYIIKNTKLLTKTQLKYIKKNYYVFVQRNESMNEDDDKNPLNVETIPNDMEIAIIPKYIAERKIPFLYEKKKMMDLMGGKIDHGGIIPIDYPIGVIRFFVMSCCMDHCVLKCINNKDPNEMIGSMLLSDELGNGPLFLSVFIKYVIDILGNTSVDNENRRMKLAMLLLNPNIVFPQCTNIIRCWVLNQIETMFTKKQLLYFIMQSFDNSRNNTYKQQTQKIVDEERIYKRERIPNDDESLSRNKKMKK